MLWPDLPCLEVGPLRGGGCRGRVRQRPQLVAQLLHGAVLHIGRPRHQRGPVSGLLQVSDTCIDNI